MLRIKEGEIGLSKMSDTSATEPFVLVVDDENALPWQAGLQAAGFRVRRCARVESAQQIIRESHDLVQALVLDVVLPYDPQPRKRSLFTMAERIGYAIFGTPPVYGGAVLAKWLREWERQRGKVKPIPTVFFSSYASVVYNDAFRPCEWTNGDCRDMIAAVRRLTGHDEGPE